jgi:DNA/RNA endonuclease G (NUC1)
MIETGLNFDPEKMTEPFVDDDYDTRGGYDQDFLGIPVPMPHVADPSIVGLLGDGNAVIAYEHFSVVMHAARRLALFTAANIDGSESAKEPEPGLDYSRKGLTGLGANDIEKWVTEPRLDKALQLPDKFYTSDRGNFDKGHIVRRDDVAWGANYAEVRRANGDTYHVTNCSPQVDVFNRSNLRGEWGKLENFILRQAKTERLCVLAGPVLDDHNDKVFTGKDDDGPVKVQIPSRFWKVVVARTGDTLQTFAFLLEQDLTDSEVEFDLDAEWQGKLISLSDLEHLVPDLEFHASLHDSDQSAAPTGEDVRQKAGLDRHDDQADTRPPSEPIPTTSTDAPTDTGEPVVGPAWSDETSPAELAERFAAGNLAGVELLLDALLADLGSTGRTVERSAAIRVLAELRRHAWFERMEQVAAKLVECSVDDAQVRRQLAQARIEVGRITEAVEGLLELRATIEAELADPGTSVAATKDLENELGETLGLLGRAYKQYYVSARPSAVEPRLYDAETSLAYYSNAYGRRLGDHLWHGVNAVALLTHRERISRADRHAGSPEAQHRAREIVEEISSRPEKASWDYANLIEANLAIGDGAAAIEAAKGYLDRTDAFGVQSTRRQLVDLWMLTDDEPPGDVILPMFNARLAEVGGGTATVRLQPEKAGDYEKVWGQTGYKSLRWLSQAFERAAGVARIGPNKYDGDGTGFLFDGSWISEEWAGRHLLITNAHVCSDDPDVQAQYPYPQGSDALTAAFLGSGTAEETEELRFTGVVWTSPPSLLDATLLELAGPPPEGATPPPRTNRVPPVSLKGDARLNILGYPKGLDLRISLQDNEATGVGETYVHYRTPTDPGSSGSPVFNQSWQLVALHHASSNGSKTNEGVRIDRILEQVRADLSP